MWPSRSPFARSFIVALALTACGDDARRALGERCAADSACASDTCGAGVCLDPDRDEDHDGLANAAEIALGTQPFAADSDGDGVIDGAETDDGDALDSDGDGAPDALESLVADGDGDCLPDQLDPRDGPGDDLAAMVANACRTVGVCAGAALVVTCDAGLARCDYAAVDAYEADERACDGRDNDCDGATDEGSPDLDADGLADCVDPDRDGDGAADSVDGCPTVADDAIDSDGDGAGDACDVPVPPIATALAPASPGTERAPVLSGIADPQATIAVWEAAGCDGAALATGSAAADGTFALAVAVADNRETRFWLAARNAAGLASACVPSAFAYVHDDRAPAAPELDGITPPSPSADDTPRVDGRAEPGATVALFASAACSGAALGEGEADATGAYAIVISVPTNALTTVHAIAIDRAGNRSACVTLASYTHDGQRPDPPRPHPSPFSPASPSTTTTSPLLRGCADDGATVDVYDRIGCVAGLVASFTADAEDADCGGGSAFFGFVVATPNAATTFYGQTRNGSGVVSACVPLGTFVHDGMAPAAPTLDGVSPTSPSSVATPTILGRAEPFAAVDLYRDAACTAAIGAGDADHAGHFAIVANVTPNATTAIFGRATDAVGSSSACVALTTYRHDGTQPTPPWPHPQVPFSPPSPSSSDDTPSVRGCAPADADVLVFASDGCTGEPLAHLKAALADAACGQGAAFGGPIAVTGKTTFRAVTENGIGLRSACATLGTYDFDDVAPAAPAVDRILPPSPAPSVTPVVFGRAEAGARVTLYRGAGCTTGVPLGTATAGPTGEWAIAGALEVLDGTTRFFAWAEDEAGNRSACAALGSYLHDDLPPAPPSAVPQAMSSSNQDVVRAHLCADAGSRVEVFASDDCSGAASEATVVVGGGACGDREEQSFVALVDRVTTFHARARDAAGNASACAALFTYDYDVVAPAPPTIARVRGTSWSLVDPRTIGSVSFEVRGAAEPSARVTLFLDGAQVANVSADASGAFVASIANVNARAPGERLVQARATDVAGNTGALGAGLAVVGDARLTFWQDGAAAAAVSAGWQYPDGTLFESVSSDAQGVVARRVFAGMMVTWGFERPLGPAVRRTLETFMDLMPGDALELELPSTAAPAAPSTIALDVGFPALAGATDYVAQSACGAVARRSDAAGFARLEIDRACADAGDTVDVLVLAVAVDAGAESVLAYARLPHVVLADSDSVTLVSGWTLAGGPGSTLTSARLGLASPDPVAFAFAAGSVQGAPEAGLVGASLLSAPLANELALTRARGWLAPGGAIAVGLPTLPELGPWRRELTLQTIAGAAGELDQTIRWAEVGSAPPSDRALDHELLPRTFPDPTTPRGADPERPRFGWVADPGLAVDAGWIALTGAHDCLGTCTDSGDPCDGDDDCGETCAIYQCSELVWRIAFRPLPDLASLAPPELPNGFSSPWHLASQRALALSGLGWLDASPLAGWEGAKTLGRHVFDALTPALGGSGVWRQSLTVVR